MKHKGFFYRNEYYLLPDGVNGVEDLPMDEFTAVFLDTYRCVPPYFIEEDCKEETLVLTAPVFPVDVEVLPFEEYERRLKKQVCARCKNCVRYDEQGDLSGHFNEMSLGGVCYLKEVEEDAPALLDGVVSALYALSEKAEELALCVQTGDEKKFSRLVSSCMRTFPFAVDSFGRADEDGYSLFFSSNVYGVSGFAALMKVFSDVANDDESPFKKAGWTTYPYFPKDEYRPSISPDFFKKPPALYARIDEEGESLEIYCLQKGAEGWNDQTASRRGAALYRYLCSCVGENLLLAATSRLRIVEDAPEGTQEVTVERLFDELKARAYSLYGGVPFPAPFFLRPQEGEATYYPYKENPEAWTTICPELPPHEETEGGTDARSAFLSVAGRALMEALGLGYAYLFVPYQEGYDAPALCSSAIKACAESFSSFVKGSFISVGKVMTKYGECEDFLLLDERRFFDFVAYLSPMLKALEARIVLVKSEGAIVYEADFELRPVGDELLS